MAKTKTVIKNCNSCRHHDVTGVGAISTCNYLGKPAMIVRNVYCLGGLYWEPIPKSKKKK